jgi:hypothetical protein
VERIGRSISGRFEFFPRVEFFMTVQTKTGLTGSPNQSDRFSTVGCREEFLARKTLLCYGYFCSKEERFLRQVFSWKGFWGVSRQNRPNRFVEPV